MAIASLGAQPQDRGVCHHIRRHALLGHAVQQAKGGVQQPGSQCGVGWRLARLESEVIGDCVRLDTCKPWTLYC